MKHKKRMTTQLGGFSSGASLGGKVSHYRDKQNIYKQGSPAYTLFYIQKGGVRLSTRTKQQPPAVTAILGVGEFFGELCLAGYPLRMSTAVALTGSSIRTIPKKICSKCFAKKIRRQMPWWPICSPASRSTRIMFRSYLLLLPSNVWRACFCG